MVGLDTTGLIKLNTNRVVKYRGARRHAPTTIYKKTMPIIKRSIGLKLLVREAALFCEWKNVIDWALGRTKQQEREEIYSPNRR